MAIQDYRKREIGYAIDKICDSSHATDNDIRNSNSKQCDSGDGTDDDPNRAIQLPVHANAMQLTIKLLAMTHTRMSMRMTEMTVVISSVPLMAMDLILQVARILPVKATRKMLLLKVVHPSTELGAMAGTTL